jgi:predicted nucleic acid-binding protein
VLLYAYDTSAGERHQQASELVLRLARTAMAAISVQVMQEFYVNAVTKIAQRLTPDAAVLRLEAFSRWYVYSPLPGDVIDAARLATRYQLSYWDSMIVTSAVRLGCEVLWSEDLNAGQVIEGVTICNPFNS